MAKKTEHPLANYKPTSETPVTNKAQCVCQVRSLKGPQIGPDGKRKDSLGRLRVKGGDPEFAARHYRETKHLPEDWPVVVQVLELVPEKRSEGRVIEPARYVETQKVKCPPQKDD